MAEETTATAPTEGTGGTPAQGENVSLLGGTPVPDAGSGANAGTESNQEGSTAGEQTGQDAKPQGAPEKYEFKAPEGMTLDQALIGEFEPLAREMNLNQESAQKLVDFYAKAQGDQTKALADNWTKQGQNWLVEVKADPEIGGEHLSQTLKNIEAVQAKFGTPKLTEGLKSMGLDNHPELVRFFSRLGAAMGEGSFVHGDPSTPKPTFAQRMYPGMKP